MRHRCSSLPPLTTILASPPTLNPFSSPSWHSSAFSTRNLHSPNKLLHKKNISSSKNSTPPSNPNREISTASSASTFSTSPTATRSHSTPTKTSPQPAPSK